MLKVIAAVVATCIMLPDLALAAADIPANSTTTAKLAVRTLPIAGNWYGLNDSDWYRVALKKGRTYAMFLDETGDASAFTLTLRDPSGKQLQKASGFDDSNAGLEFTAPKDGIYFLDARLNGLDYGTDGNYEIAAKPDCAASTATDCVLKPGASQQRTIGFYGDVDWLKLTLKAGKAVTVTGTILREQLNDLELDIVNAKGKVLAKAVDAPLKFTPAIAGTYYVQVQDPDGESFGPYRIVEK